MIPKDLKYAESHEWARVDGNMATVGITHHAQEQLTDIVFVELPKVGQSVTKGGECGAIESCKIAAELYTPVSGMITAVNESLADHPEYVNQEPYGKGWIMQIEMSDPSELESLMDAEGYRRYLETSA
jgi:glycine cleavage system H protein